MGCEILGMVRGYVVVQGKADCQGLQLALCERLNSTQIACSKAKVKPASGTVLNPPAGMDGGNTTGQIAIADLAKSGLLDHLPEPLLVGKIAN